MLTPHDFVHARRHSRSCCSLLFAVASCCKPRSTVVAIACETRHPHAHISARGGCSHRFLQNRTPSPRRPLIKLLFSGVYFPFTEGNPRDLDCQTTNHREPPHPPPSPPPHPPPAAPPHPPYQPVPFPPRALLSIEQPLLNKQTLEASLTTFRPQLPT